MTNSVLKRSLLITAVALAMLFGSSSVFAGQWVRQSKQIDGIYGIIISCIDHGNSLIGAWEVSENVAPTITPCCVKMTKGHVYSKGTVVLTLKWETNDPQHDPPPFKQYFIHTIGIDHVKNGLPAGTATSSLGSPTAADPYHVVAYSWENTRSGVITFTYQMEADVEGGPTDTISACVSAGCAPSSEAPGNGAQMAKVSPSKYCAMPMYPESVRRVTQYANFAPGDPVNLATGEHIYSPNADISVYNPYGPAVVYQRNFLSSLAADQKHSLGLPIGWNDGFDIKFISSTPSSWGNLRLVYPNDAEEIATPILSGGTPTGQFTLASGSEYMVTGVPSSTTGQWNQITVTHKDRTKWKFSPIGSDTYLLSSIANRMGRSISIIRDSQNNNRITAIQDDQSTPIVLLSFSYQNGYLSSLTDCYGRKVSYGYGNTSGMACLTSVSQISDSIGAPARSTYGYQVVGNPSALHLTSVSVPSPTGSGLSTETFAINPQGRVSSIIDANGILHQFDYAYPDATRVVVRNQQYQIEQESLMSFDINHSNILISTTDAAGHVAKRDYGDTNNPFLPTKITDKLGKAVEVTYDQFGNILTSKSARGTVTTYRYDYDIFPLGRLIESEEGTNLPANDPARLPKTTITYYEPSGLVQSITYPKPGTTGPNGEMVTTTFTYDLVDDQNAGTRGLGNILAITNPGNNAAASITTTYYYGSYAQVKLGQPLSITDNLNHSTYFDYDARGNIKTATDALGNKVDYIYNIADQVTSILHPHTAPLP